MIHEIFFRILNFRFPEMSTSYVGQCAINGILENRRIFSVPSNHLLLVRLVRYAHRMHQYCIRIMSKLFDTF